MKKRKADAPSTSASSTKCSKSCQKLKFVAFCAARQAVLLNRRDGLPQAEWTNDRILARARFCNIDRRDDAVTAVAGGRGTSLGGKSFSVQDGHYEKYRCNVCILEMIKFSFETLQTYF